MIQLLIVLIVVGVLLFLVNQIPMDPAIQTIIRVVVIVCVVFYVLSAFGVIDLPVPSMRSR